MSFNNSHSEFPTIINMVDEPKKSWWSEQTTKIRLSIKKIKNSMVNKISKIKKTNFKSLIKKFTPEPFAPLNVDVPSNCVILDDVANTNIVSSWCDKINYLISENDKTHEISNYLEIEEGYLVLALNYSLNSISNNLWKAIMKIIQYCLYMISYTKYLILCCTYLKHNIFVILSRMLYLSLSLPFILVTCILKIILSICASSIFLLLFVIFGIIGVY